jgi:hypothetical protein
MAIEHENIMKVVDINHSQLTKEFIDFIDRQQPTYRDQILREDLYSSEDILEEESSQTTPYPAGIVGVLTEIKTLLFELDCSYFRVVYS